MRWRGASVVAARSTVLVAADATAVWAMSYLLVRDALK
jgi:hypothetical protein